MRTGFTRLGFARHRAMITTVVGTIAAVGLVPVPVAAADTAGITAQFGRQHLTWEGCPGIDTPGLQCAKIRVPLDYAHPAGGSIALTVSRLPATDQARRRGVLLTTGGGPGGPGVPLPGDLARILDPGVSARYDLIGFDLRFVERSTPISCGQPEEEPGGWWGRFAEYTSFQTVAEAAERYARDCARHAGWALPHATTANVARDMDVIRSVLGERKISYIGGSYAATLGAGYASMFPDRVDRFVLDSPPDYTKAWRQFDLDRTGAMEENLAAFAEWIAADDASYHLGTTGAAVISRITELFSRSAKTPIRAGDHAWTLDEIAALVIGAIFFDQDWSYYAPGLAAIAAGTAPPNAYQVRPGPLPGTPGVPADNHTALGTSFWCADGPWSTDLDSYRRDVREYSAKHPVFGSLNANVGPCAFWPVRTGIDRIKFGTKSAPGTLVLAALHDASVPLTNSVAVRTALAGSRLVTIDRRTHVPLLNGAANGCMAKAVTDLLIDGALPTTDLAC